MSPPAHGQAHAPLIYAHRGDSRHAPENTLTSFRAAARAGAEGAALNVLINLGAIADAAFKDACVKETGALVADARRLCDAVQDAVKAGFGVKAGF